MSPRGPSGASKSLFKNLKKPSVFEGFWVQRPPKRASRCPIRLPRDPQKLHKKQNKKFLKNASMVKNALSRRSHLKQISKPIFASKIALFLKHLLHKVCYQFLEESWNLLGAHFRIRAAQDSQDEPKRDIRTFKTPCKKRPKKKTKNASVVKNALSRRSHF